MEQIQLEVKGDDIFVGNSTLRQQLTEDELNEKKVMLQQALAEEEREITEELRRINERSLKLIRQAKFPLQLGHDSKRNNP